jgi:Fe2+ transport system protein FeoA
MDRNDGNAPDKAATKDGKDATTRALVPENHASLAWVMAHPAPFHAAAACRAGESSSPRWQPLSRARAGDTVVVRRLEGSDDTNRRLREMGFGEEQRVRVISLQSHVLCQVCNARLGVSAKLADIILVEALPHPGGVGLRLSA